MRSEIVLTTLCLLLCLASSACHSGGEDAEYGVVPEMLEFPDCTLSVPCMIVTPETLGEVPEPVLAAAEKHIGAPGTVVVVSGLRPRYFRFLRDQGRLLLGSVETGPSAGTVYLCVLSGLGEAAETVRSVLVENPEALEPWNLGVFARRYPGLAARLNELPPGDERLDAAESASRELLSRGSTRALLEKRGGAKSAALEAAVQDEQEQIGVLEEILNSK